MIYEGILTRKRLNWITNFEMATICMAFWDMDPFYTGCIEEFWLIIFIFSYGILKFMLSAKFSIL